MEGRPGLTLDKQREALSDALILGMVIMRDHVVERGLIVSLIRGLDLADDVLAAAPKGDGTPLRRFHELLERVNKEEVP